MQVRRLITVLNNMIKKDPGLAYAQVAVFSEAFKSEYFAVKGLSEVDLGPEFMEWDNGMEVEERRERQVLVIGVDQFRMKYK